MPSIRTILRTTALTAVATAGLVAASMPIASAAALPGCTNHDPVIVCETEPVNSGIGATVFKLDLNPVHLADVAGYADTYKVPYGNDQYLTVPCLVLWANGNTYDACAGLGLQRDASVPRVYLVDQPADAATPSVGGPYADVYVCTAKLTATVAGQGIHNQPLPTICVDTY